MQSPYDPELRAEIRQRMNPPNRESVAEIARSTGVNAQTLYRWRHRWKQEGQLVPASSKAPELWSAADKLAAVIQAAGLSGADLGAGGQGLPALTQPRVGGAELKLGGV